MITIDSDGYVVDNAIADTLARVEALKAQRVERERVAASARSTADIRAGYPILAQERRKRSRGRVAVLSVLATLATLWTIGHLAPDDAATSSVPASVSLAPMVSPLSAVEMHQRENAATSSALQVIAGNGDVYVNGAVVDNIMESDSPLRAQYLDAFARNHVPAAIPDRVVREGIQFCADMESGRVVPLRELADAMSSDRAHYGTGTRRMVVARAAVESFCPQYSIEAK